MAVINYDSDSTEDDCTETNVLLGYTTKDGDEDATSKLGGTPAWLDSDNEPSAVLARCQACKGLMALLLQLNGELPDRFPGHERRLYVFACRRSGCRRKAGSVRALRGVRLWEEEEQVTEKENVVDERHDAQVGDDNTMDKGKRLGETLFGVTAMGGSGKNPFSKGTHPLGSDTASNPFSSPLSNLTKSQSEAATSDRDTVLSLSKTFAETLALNVPPPPAATALTPPPHEPWPGSPALPKPYPTLFISDAEYETLDPSILAPKNISVQLDDADAPEPSILDREAFESSMDATFQKFADRLVQNPDQVIRYEFAGAPLLYSTTDAVGTTLTGPGMPPCANCGASRVFEVQLTPNVIALLEENELTLDGMEWGTIIVGVCQRDCTPRGSVKGEAGYLEEWAGVQWEELTKHK